MDYCANQNKKSPNMTAWRLLPLKQHHSGLEALRLRGTLSKPECYFFYTG